MIDNSLKQAKIEIKQFQNIDGVFFNDTIQSDEGNLKCYYIDYFYRNGYAMYKQFLDDIKNKRIREYNFKPTITIYISQKDYNQFMINMEKRGNIYVE